jgi:hypothetical protein
MSERFEHHTVHVFTGTGMCNPSQYKYFPPACVHDQIGDMNEKLEELMEKQMEGVYEEVRKQMVERVGNKARTGDEFSVLPVKKADGATKTQNLAWEDSTGGVGHVGDKRKEKEGVGAGDHITDEMVREALRNDLCDKRRFPKSLVILDDVVDAESIRHAPALNKLAISGRHWGFTVIILSQCICGSGSVPPIIRVNSDFIISVYNPRSLNERKLLQDQYLTPTGADPKAGLKLLTDITRMPYRNIVIDVCNPNATAFAEFISYYGPVPEPPDNVSKKFKMGTKEQWEEPLPGDRVPKFNENKDGSIGSKRRRIENVNAGRFHFLERTEFGAKSKFFGTVF